MQQHNNRSINQILDGGRMPKDYQEVTRDQLQWMKQAVLTESEEQIRMYFRQIMTNKGLVNRQKVCVYTFEQLTNAKAEKKPEEEDQEAELAPSKKMGPGQSGDNKQAKFQKFTMQEIEHVMFMLVVHGTDKTSQFEKLSGLFYGMAASLIVGKVRAYLSVSTIRHFQKLSVDPFRIAVYYYIKVLLAQSKGKTKKVDQGTYVNSFHTDLDKLHKNRALNLLLNTHFIQSQSLRELGITNCQSYQGFRKFTPVRLCTLSEAKQMQWLEDLEMALWRKLKIVLEEEAKERDKHLDDEEKQLAQIDRQLLEWPHEQQGRMALHRPSPRKPASRGTPQKSQQLMADQDTQSRSMTPKRAVPEFPQMDKPVVSMQISPSQDVRKRDQKSQDKSEVVVPPTAKTTPSKPKFLDKPTIRKP